MDKAELLWKQYQQHIDTYKFYLDLVIKVMGFYFAVSGAMLSYYAANSGSDQAAAALYLPLIVGVGILFVFVVGAKLSWVTRKDVYKIRDRLGLEVAPETGVLTMLLAVFSLVLVGCIAYFAYVLAG